MASNKSSNDLMSMHPVWLTQFLYTFIGIYKINHITFIPDVLLSLILNFCVTPTTWLGIEQRDEIVLRATISNPYNSTLLVSLMDIYQFNSQNECHHASQVKYEKVVAILTETDIHFTWNIVNYSLWNEFKQKSKILKFVDYNTLIDEKTAFQIAENLNLFGDICLSNEIINDFVGLSTKIIMLNALFHKSEFHTLRQSRFLWRHNVSYIPESIMLLKLYEAGIECIGLKNQYTLKSEKCTVIDGKILSKITKVGWDSFILHFSGDRTKKIKCRVNATERDKWIAHFSIHNDIKIEVEEEQHDEIKQSYRNISVETIEHFKSQHSMDQMDCTQNANFVFDQNDSEYLSLYNNERTQMIPVEDKAILSIQEDVTEQRNCCVLL